MGKSQLGKLPEETVEKDRLPVGVLLNSRVAEIWEVQDRLQVGVLLNNIVEVMAE
jgi:hypothetical protein